MPHKSKAQKKRSDKAKKIAQLINVRPTTKPSKSPVRTGETTVQNESELMVTKATKADLTKTIVIIAALFALEFAIFYATLN